MRKTLLLIIASALLLPAQSQSDKTTPQPAPDRLERLRTELRGNTTVGPRIVLFNEEAPKTCSVPLIEIPAPKIDQSMVIPTEKSKSPMPVLKAPAPACSKEWLKSRQER